MSVLDSGVVDFIGIDLESGAVVLTISDHLDWTNEEDHIRILQLKMNSYLALVESGELVETYEKAKGRPVVISVSAKFPPGQLGREFFEHAKAKMREGGISFAVEVLETGDSGIRHSGEGNSGDTDQWR